MKKKQRGDTEYLLSSHTNAASLAESVNQFKRWKIKKPMQYTSLRTWRAFINTKLQSSYAYDGIGLKPANLPTALAGIPDSCLVDIPSVCFDRKSIRRQILKQLGLAFREAGWSPNEAAKRANIRAQLLADILEGKHSLFSNDELLEITKAIEVIKPSFIYLDDIRKHLDFLYSYCDVASSGTAFNMPEQQILELIESDWRPPRGVPLKYIVEDDGSFTIMEDKNKSIDDLPDLQAERAPVTLQALPELRTFSLAVTMLDFVETDRLHLMDRLIQKPYFTNEVFRVFHELSKIPEEEIIKAKEFQLDSKERVLRNAEEELKRIKSGYESRQDFLDMTALIDWVKSKNIVIHKIQDLIDHPDYPLRKDAYGIDTIKKWYRVAQPEIRLLSGRPKKKK